MGEAEQNGNTRPDQGGSGVCEENIRPGADNGSVGVRLNLGCGGKQVAGYIGVDFEENYSGVKPDVVADLRSLPFEDGSVDEVLAVHVIEHFYLWEVEDVLKEWKRVLKPGGKIVLELPCLDKIINAFIEYSGAPPVNLAMWGLYGDPGHKDEKMCHRWAYSVNALRALLGVVGFQEIEERKPEYHVAVRDMRMEAINA